MSAFGRFSWIFGSFLLGFSAVLICDRSRSSPRRNDHHHVEELAERLKQAWSEHHVP